MSEHDKSRRFFLNAGAATIAATLIPASVKAEEYQATAKQTEGPYYPRHKQLDKNADMTKVGRNSASALGEVLIISGRVFDTDGKPVKGAIIDIWQADKNGRYLHEDAPDSSPIDANFQYWAQIKSDEEGKYQVKTIKPGKYPAMGDWVRPPHIHFKVARSGLKELTTQMYFANEALNKKDKLFIDLPKSEQSSIVVNFEKGKGIFDIVLNKLS